MSLYQRAREKHPELPNIGKPWTTDQETLLIKRVAEGKNNEELSKEFGRTTGGIRSRLRQIACEMVELGKSIEYTMEKTKLSREVIQESLDKRSSVKGRKFIKQKKSEMKEMISLMKEIRDLLKKFVESVEVQ